VQRLGSPIRDRDGRIVPADGLRSQLEHPSAREGHVDGDDGDEVVRGRLESRDQPAQRADAGADVRDLREPEPPQPVAVARRDQDLVADLREPARDAGREPLAVDGQRGLVHAHTRAVAPGQEDAGQGDGPRPPHGEPVTR
jgi:hypothetical protein